MYERLPKRQRTAKISAQQPALFNRTPDNIAHRCSALAGDDGVSLHSIHEGASKLQGFVAAVVEPSAQVCFGQNRQPRNRKSGDGRTAEQSQDELRAGCYFR